MRRHRLLPAASVLLLLAGACDDKAPSTAPEPSLVASRALPTPYQGDPSVARALGTSAAVTDPPSFAMASAVSSDGLVTIDFEGYTDLVPITTQYSALGVTFSGATTLVGGSSLNTPFPPHSGRVVVYDQSGAGGVIAATFERAVSSVGVYVTANTIITMTCFDHAGGELGQSILPAANYMGAGNGVAPNFFLSVVASGIRSCTFHDHGNTFTMDDFSFDPSGSGRLPQPPETPGTIRHGSERICYGTPVPRGWIVVDAIYVDPNCRISKGPLGEFLVDAWVIKSYFDQPIGTRMTVCRFETTPANWVVVEPTASDGLVAIQCTWPEGALGQNGGAKVIYHYQ